MCRLAEAGYRAIAPDLPGYGTSQGFDVVNYALENQMKLLHEFVKGLGIDRIDIAGSSMGGAISTLYTQQYSQQVRSLAFIGSPLGVIGWAKPVKDAIYQGINPFIPITKDQFDPRSQLLKLSNAGHLLLIENAEAAASAYLRFLQSNAAAPSKSSTERPMGA